MRSARCEAGVTSHLSLKFGPAGELTGVQSCMEGQLSCK